MKSSGYIILILLILTVHCAKQQNKNNKTKKQHNIKSTNSTITGEIPNNDTITDSATQYNETESLLLGNFIS